MPVNFTSAFRDDSCRRLSSLLSSLTIGRRLSRWQDDVRCCAYLTEGLASARCCRFARLARVSAYGSAVFAPDNKAVDTFCRRSRLRLAMRPGICDMPTFINLPAADKRFYISRLSRCSTRTAAAFFMAVFRQIACTARRQISAYGLI